VLTSRNLNGGNTTTAIKEDVIAKDGTYFFNYPNPVDDQTTFVYNLSSTQTVSLKVYDLEGREVVELLNARQNAGEHEIKWNAVAAANGLDGLYFAKLKIGQNVKTIKVLMQK
jgi:hypothetical protein